LRISLMSRIIIGLFCIPFVSQSYDLVRVLYTISFCFKDFLMLILPIVIFAYMTYALVNLKGSATISFLLSMLFFVAVSNFIVQWYAYGISRAAIGFLNIKSKEMAGIGNMTPFFKMPFKPLITSTHGMILACIFGFIIRNKRKIESFKNNISKYLGSILNIFLPFYITGFLAKLYVDGIFGTLASGYAPGFIIDFGAQCLYVILMFFVVGGGASPFEKIKNILPAMLTGFATMSSAATMPLTMKYSENNVNNKALIPLVIPTTVNIHMIGESVSTVFFSLLTLSIFGKPIPGMFEYLLFSLKSTFVKFAGAAVPGGGIIVMTPVLQEYLGMDDTLISLVTTLFLIQDPMGTATNIGCNSAFLIGMDRLYKKFFSKK
jgi:Na+/H+-dicarboxylate symporter